MAPGIDELRPKVGWPGSIVEILGAGFSAARDDNDVQVGGVPALVIEAAPTRLLILVGEGAATGPLTVTVGGATADAGEFPILEHPDAADTLTPGTPVFFHGPQHGTPSTNRADQRVLVLPVFPSDNPPPAGVDLLTPQRTKFDQADHFWREASYRSTSWAFDHHPGWLRLPKAETFYFVDQTHVDAARLAFLAADQRIVGGGGVIFGSARGGFLPVLHPSPLSWSFLLGPGGGDGTQTLALLRVGNRLYTGTAGGAFSIYDVSNPGAATLVGRVPLVAPVWDIALRGNTAVVALGPAGLGAVDVSNPANPSVFTPGAGANTNWTTRVRLSGDRVYSNRGAALRMHTVSNTGAFSFLGEVDARAWITGIDVSPGGTIAVATDGRGLVTLEATAGGALQRGTNTDLPYLREVTISGDRAYVAAAADGLAVYDIANRAAPALLGSKKFVKDANSVVLQGNEAVVALGSPVLVSVDVSNPAAMRLASPEQQAGSNVPMADRRAALLGKADAIGMAVDFHRVFLDALRAWFTATGRGPADLDAYEGIAVIVHSGGVRALSGVYDALRTGGEGLRFNNAKGIFYDDSSGAWTTLAHELVHWLRVGDVYEERYADGRILTGTAGPWCMSGVDPLAPLFSAERMRDHLAWLTVGQAPGPDVRELVWSPTSAIDETFVVVAHASAPDPDPNRYQALRLVVSSGMTYWVEVRQASPAGLPFDQNLPLAPGQPGAVVVMRATDEESVVDNTFERPLQVMGVLQPGQKVVDASRNLVITAEAVVGANPLAYRVHVQWNQPIPENPDGTFDLTITPWNTDTYETVDIWVDSTRRNPAGSYEFHEPGDPTLPILSGDRPWVGHDNTIHARIRNTGPQQADDVWVSCYITRPPGIGDNGEWQILETVNLPALPAFGERTVDFVWRPEVAAHTCMSIAILPKLGEVTGKNNRAQENIAVFDSASGSSHAPVILEAEIRNPFTIAKEIQVRVRRLPDLWHAVADVSRVWLPPRGSAPVRVVIWTDIQTWGLERGPGERLALPAIEGWTIDHDHWRPIGGTLAAVRAVPGVSIDLTLEAGGGAIYVWGRLDPPAWDVPTVAEIIDEGGRALLLYGMSEGDGRFHMNTPEAGVRLDPGRYTVQVFTSGSENAAETESELRLVELDV